MLVLARKVGQRLVLGDGRITLVVLSIDWGQVRFGIEAPREVRIDRAECVEKPDGSRLAQ